jgi:hypothetical protein
MVSPPTLPDPEEPADGEKDEDLIPEYTETDDSDLEVDVHMEADGNRVVGTLTAKGDDFRHGRANAHALGELIRAHAVALYEIAMSKKGLNDWVAWPDIDRFEFASAHIRFVPGENETIRMEDPISPTVEASRRIAEMMEAQGDDLVELAREVGPKGAKAYQQLLKVVAESDDAEVEWESTDREPVTVSSIDAKRAFATLDREGENESAEFTVAGHLSMADAELNRFKLKLPSGAPRPPQLKGKRTVTGVYDDPVGQLVKEQGLWDSDVLAEIRVEREREETVATPRKPSFKLISVERVVLEPQVEAEGGDSPIIRGSMSFDDDEQEAG